MAGGSLKGPVLLSGRTGSDGRGRRLKGGIFSLKIYLISAGLVVSFWRMGRLFYG